MLALKFYVILSTLTTPTKTRFCTDPRLLLIVRFALRERIKIIQGRALTSLNYSRLLEAFVANPS